MEVQQPIHRLFFAIKPDPVTARRTDVFAEEIAAGARRVRPEHHHVTLAITKDYAHFPRPLADALLQAGTAVAADPFDLTLDRLAASRRSVALRPAKSHPPLMALQRQIASAVDRQRISQRPGWSFSPHQTLFYREGEPWQRPVQGFRWQVGEFVLVHSLVGRTRHDILGRWPLTGGSDGQPDLFGPLH